MVCDAPPSRRGAGLTLNLTKEMTNRYILLILLQTKEQYTQITEYSTYNLTQSSNQNVTQPRHVLSKVR